MGKTHLNLEKPLHRRLLERPVLALHTSRCFIRDDVPACQETMCNCLLHKTKGTGGEEKPLHRGGLHSVHSTLGFCLALHELKVPSG